MEDIVKNLIKKSKEIILDCCLENGAILAANTDKKYYPKNVTNYRYVWPRDVAFTLYAAHLLGLDNIQKNFIKWLLNRAENFSKTGMIFQRYFTNGPRDPYFGYQYQPDQSGALLWVLLETNEILDDDTKKTINLIANSLCNTWNKKNFKIPTSDLWEEEQTFPDIEDNFTYTLAACSIGLKKAYEKLKNEKWLEVSKEMKELIINHKGENYTKIIGKIRDNRIDASLLSLIWPFNIIDKNNKKLLKTLDLIEKNLFTEQGIKRYIGDKYDGEIQNLKSKNKGAGGWPLLTFWYIICLHKLNRKEEAKKLFEKYIQNFTTAYIPEQIFNNKLQTSISPLCWSHSMLIIAAKELGHLI